MASKSVDRAANAGRSTVEDMGVNHRRFNVAMAQEFLDRSDIVPAFKQMRGEGEGAPDRTPFYKQSTNSPKS